MPYSAPSGKLTIIDFLQHLNRNTSFLDIGPGAGVYGEILKKLNFPNSDAVEVFAPYVDRFNLRSKYRNVYICNIMDFKFENKYDIAIMGDILEHLTVTDAQMIIQRLKENVRCIIVSVPWVYKQGESEENVHEIHVQADLTPEIFFRRYGEDFRMMYFDHILGVYIWDKKLASGTPDAK